MVVFVVDVSLEKKRCCFFTFLFALKIVFISKGFLASFFCSLVILELFLSRKLQWMLFVRKKQRERVETRFVCSGGGFSSNYNFWNWSRNCIKTSSFLLQKFMNFEHQKSQIGVRIHIEHWIDFIIFRNRFQWKMKDSGRIQNYLNCFFGFVVLFIASKAIIHWIITLASALVIKTIIEIKRAKINNKMNFLIYFSFKYLLFMN